MQDKRHYEAIIKRGLINENTTLYDFLKKFREEFFELNKELYIDAFEPEQKLRHVTVQEAIDVIKTLENMLIHFGVDIQEATEINIKTQEKRINGAKHISAKTKTRSKSNN